MRLETLGLAAGFGIAAAGWGLALHVPQATPARRIPGLAGCQGDIAFTALVDAAWVWTDCGAAGGREGGLARLEPAGLSVRRSWPVPEELPLGWSEGLARGDEGLGWIYRSPRAGLVAAVAGREGWLRAPEKLPGGERARLVSVAWAGSSLLATLEPEEGGGMEVRIPPQAGAWVVTTGVVIAEAPPVDVDAFPARGVLSQVSTSRVLTSGGGSAPVPDPPSAAGVRFLPRGGILRVDGRELKEEPLWWQQGAPVSLHPLGGRLFRIRWDRGLLLSEGGGPEGRVEAGSDCQDLLLAPWVPRPGGGFWIVSLSGCLVAVDDQLRRSDPVELPERLERAGPTGQIEATVLLFGLPVFLAASALAGRRWRIPAARSTALGAVLFAVLAGWFLSDLWPLLR